MAATATIPSSAGSGADKLTGGVGNDNFFFEGVSDISGLAETIDGGNDIDTIGFRGARRVRRGQPVQGDDPTWRLFLNSQNDVTLTAAAAQRLRNHLGGQQSRPAAPVGGRHRRPYRRIDLRHRRVPRNLGRRQLHFFSGVSNGQTVNTLAGADTVTGSEGSDTINSGADADVVKAGTGNDSLTGETGNDKLYGEDGNDILNGGTGLDVMGGSAGNDIFRVAFVADISGLAETLSGGTDTDQLDFATLGAIGRVDLTKATISSVEMLSLNANDVTLTAAQLGAFTTLSAGSNPDRLILCGGRGHGRPDGRQHLRHRRIPRFVRQRRDHHQRRRQRAVHRRPGRQRHDRPAATAPTGSGATSARTRSMVVTVTTPYPGGQQR